MNNLLVFSAIAKIAILFLGLAQTAQAQVADSFQASPFQVVKTEACEKGNNSSDVSLPDFFLWKIINKDHRKIVINPRETCLRYKSKIKVFSDSTAKPILDAQVEKIFIVKNQRQKNFHLETQAMAAKYALENPAANDETNFTPFAVIEFKIERYINIATKDFTKIFQGKNPYAQTIDKARTTALINNGGFVGFTLSEGESPNTTEFRNSSSIVWSKESGGFVFDDSTSSLKKSTTTTPLASLPSKKNYPFVLMGIDQYDHRPQIAAYELARLGYKNLYLFEGGLREWKSPSDTIPSQHFAIKLLNAPQTLQKNLSAAVIVDVRKTPITTQGAVSNATNIPYTEAITSPRKRSVLAESLLEDQFDLSKLPFNKSAELVFYGIDQNDWTPLKAAIKAHNAGYKRVFVFRGGFSHWEYYRQKYPQRFSVKPL